MVNDVPIYMQGSVPEQKEEQESVVPQIESNIPIYMQGSVPEQKEEQESNVPIYMQGSDISQPNIDEPSNIRKAQYGAAQETYLLGDAYRLTYAAFSPSKTRQKIERERQQRIFDEFPEFKNGKYDSDAAVISGRALVMVVTQFI